MRDSSSAGGSTAPQGGSDPTLFKPTPQWQNALIVAGILTGLLLAHMGGLIGPRGEGPRALDTQPIAADR